MLVTIMDMNEMGVNLIAWDIGYVNHEHMSLTASELWHEQKVIRTGIGAA